MKKHLHVTALTLLCAITAGCQTTSQDTLGEQDLAAAKPCLERALIPDQVVVNPTAMSTQTTPSATDTWVTLYLDAGKLTEKEIADIIEAPLASSRAADYATLDEPGKILHQATVLAGSRLQYNWAKAQRLLAGLDGPSQNRLPTLWLQRILADKQSLAEQLGRRQTELEAARAAQQLLENELIDMKQKIEALTQIENALIDKQVEVLAP